MNYALAIAQLVVTPFKEQIMTIETLRNKLPDFAKDIRLNLSTLFTNIAQTGLSESQFYGLSLAVAYSLKNKELIESIIEEGQDYLHTEIKEAAKIAATLMAMNNIYYRAIHLAENGELRTMPANLRMNAMLNPGVDKIDFELFSLAVSAINGCGMCIQAHVKQLEHHEVDKKAIQSSLRIAASLNALVVGLAIVE